MRALTKGETVAAGLIFGTCAGLGTLFITGIVMLFLTGTGAANHDFVAYWSAGKLLLSHGNPYDAGAVLSLQRSEQFPDGYQALIMRNPPPALPLAAVFAIGSFRAGAWAWAAFSLLAIAISIKLLHKIYRRADRLATVLGFSFAPSLLCVLAGQSSLLVLLGYTVFLFSYRRYPFLAGSALWFCALKPHLFLPTATIFLLWSFANKTWTPLCGLLATLAITSGFAAALRPKIFVDYRALLQSPVLHHEAIPCISVSLRELLPPHTTLIQMLPSVLACFWGAAYFLRRRETWRWEREGNILLVVSLTSAPYAWVTDQAILTPAIFAAIALSRSRHTALFAAVLSAVIEAQILLKTNLHSYAFLWAAPAWLVFHLWSSNDGYAMNTYDPPPTVPALAMVIEKP